MIKIGTSERYDRLYKFKKKYFGNEYYKSKYSLEKLIGEIAELSNWINTHSKADVFCWYSGHVNLIEVRVYNLGYYRNKKDEDGIPLRDIDENIFIEEDLSNIKEIEELKNKLEVIKEDILNG